MKNRKMVILVVVILAIIVASCDPPTPTPTPILPGTVVTVTPTPGSAETQTPADACPLPPDSTSLEISTTNITFAIDESLHIPKVDEKNYRYKITKFLLNVFHDLFQQLNISAKYRVNYLFNNEQTTFRESIDSSDTEMVQDLFKELNSRIENSPQSQGGNFSSHDKYIESFLNERNTATSMGNRILFYFTDGTFFLTSDKNANGQTFDIMDGFSRQMENLSNSAEGSDRVIVFLLTSLETMRPAARTYWRGMDTLKGVDVIWITPENLESILRTAVSSVLGEENAFSSDDLQKAGYEANLETSLELPVLEGWRMFSTKNGKDNCTLDIPDLPYNVSRESSKILDLTIEYDEGVVGDVPWVDDVQNYDDCKSFTIPHPAKELLCKEPSGIYFFWWKTEEFSLGLDISDEGNIAPICNGANDPNTGTAVFKVDISKPGTIGWDKIQPCFVPQLKFKGMGEVFSTSINDEENAIFSVDPMLLERLLGEVEYTVSFKASDCNSQIGDPITNVAQFVHYPVSGEKATIEDGLTIRIPLRFYEPSSLYPAIVTFTGENGDDLCDLTSEYLFTSSNEAYGFITKQEENSLSIEFLEGFVGPAIKACNEMQISWQTAQKNDYWEKIRASCGDVKETVLKYSLKWDETENQLISIEEKP